MRGLAEIGEQNKKDILGVFKRSIEKGDVKTAKNIRSIHTDLEVEFSALDHAGVTK